MAPGPMILGPTNSFEVTRLEGLYVEERTPPAAILGANFSLIGITGETVRGPVGKAVFCGSPQRFLDVFGGRAQASGTALVNKVWKSLQNKKFGGLWIVRVAAAAAVAASKSFSNAVPTAIIRVDAASPGVWGNDISGVTIADATNGDANAFDFSFTYDGKNYLYRNLKVFSANDDNLTKVIGTDDAALVKITKLANGRPVNTSGATLNGTAGTEGSVANSDYTAAGKGINVLAATPKLGACFIAEKSNATLRAAVKTLASKDLTRFWILDGDDDTVVQASAITDVASYREKNIIYVFNHPYTIDTEAGVEMVTSPSSWKASILSQTDVNIHPGDPDTRSLLSGITRLSFTPLREDLIALKEAGICALEDTGEGFQFVSGVVTYLPDGTGQEQITHRRMVSYLEVSPLRALAQQVKKPQSPSRDEAMRGILEDFSERLQKAETVIDQDDPEMGKGFVVDLTKLNTKTARQAGLFKILWRVRLQAHYLYIDLVVEAGTQVTIKQAA